MPELPDLEAYAFAWTRSAGGQRLTGLRLASPFLLRTVAPTAASFVGRRLGNVARQGKRLVLRFDDQSMAAIHLMISGRVFRRPLGTAKPGRDTLAVLDFESHSFVLTEASKKRRASLHLFASAADGEVLRRDGIEPLEASAESWQRVVTARHTLKRLLTDPDRLSGIGNAYSDEILHAAKLSPVRLGSSLSPSECTNLQANAVSVLRTFRDRIRDELGADGFPERVTAFRPDMAVHGRFGKPCPTCTSPVQRIVRGDHETNYCATCQTGGKLLADRALSTLLHADWPKTLEAWEERRREGGAG